MTPSTMTDDEHLDRIKAKCLHEIKITEATNTYKNPDRTEYGLARLAVAGWQSTVAAIDGFRVLSVL